MVFSETITWLRYHAGFDTAKKFGEKFRHTKIIKILWIDPGLESRAWEMFLKYSDKELSYVDCLSFACMKENRIDYALTFDKHFQQVGFSILP
jgi:predicted nucleic acid-binding protein